MIRWLIDRIYPKNEYAVTLVGLDHAGKTTLLYLLKLGEVMTTIPTIGFSIETAHVPSKNGPGMRMTSWDMGWGCSPIPFPLLSHYTSCTDAIIWVVDSCDRERLSESLQWFIKILSALQSNVADSQNSKNIPILMSASFYSLLLE